MIINQGTLIDNVPMTTHTCHSLLLQCKSKCVGPSNWSVTSVSQFRVYFTPFSPFFFNDGQLITNFLYLYLILQTNLFSIHIYVLLLEFSLDSFNWILTEIYSRTSHFIIDFRSDHVVKSCDSESFVIPNHTYAIIILKCALSLDVYAVIAIIFVCQF